MPNPRPIHDVVLAWAATLAPPDKQLRFYDSDDPTPLIGVAYRLDNFKTLLHLGYAPPSKN